MQTAGGELLLELLSEEIPARMQRRAIDDLVQSLREWLQTHRIPAVKIRGYVTPRRLTVIAEGIPAQLPSLQDERRGPRLGAPRPAIEGFLRSVGLSKVEECEVRDTGRGEFYFAVLDRPGRPTTAALPDIVYAAIANLAWPKSMRYPASPLRWVRPLVSVICLFDGKVIEGLRPQLGQVPVGPTTRGHRFLSDRSITVTGAEDYLAKLEAAHVVLDQNRRRRLIEDGLTACASAAQVAVKPDQGLLDEVTGLVEYPVVLMGAIDSESMALPPEVLATAMRTHQKYFSCLNADGSAAPRFLFVANNKTPDDGRTIIAGNERVLRARLADARFFWDQDRKVPLAARVNALKDRVYHAKLGSVYDKVGRIENLAAYLAPLIAPQEKELARLAQRAAHLAKADLSTGMVGEFPELQGVIGRYYALHDGEEGRVADAIAAHYKPLGPADTCPKEPVSVALALADKIDTLVAFFRVDEKPTGSRDPFALRRAALGIIRLVLESGLRLSLSDVLKKASENFDPQQFGLWNPAPDLLPFVADRLKVHLREQGVRHDLIAAVFVLSEDDLVRLLARVTALQKFLGTEDGANLLIAYRRASNIVGIEERRDSCKYDGPIDGAALKLDEEIALYHRLNGMMDMSATSLRLDHFDRVMMRLATLRQPVDEFFANVTVNTDDPALRENRLRLLSRIREVMNQVADFSKIEG
ncbi:MAG TPA: glycine--tRNA ligase subunit beta [Stellaceae bacterium]|jgi:glycyl-tRNA synthetase beta chain|nr:glycine--tRNA ligase subunit beta [Stellaceae bacterium]